MNAFTPMNFTIPKFGNIPPTDLSEGLKIPQGQLNATQDNAYEQKRILRVYLTAQVPAALQKLEEGMARETGMGNASKPSLVASGSLLQAYVGLLNNPQ